MAQDGTKYLLLDGHQGTDPRNGWRVASLTAMEAGPGALRLAAAPAPPVPLAGDVGTFAGMENPTGVAIAPDGTVYVSDGDHDTVLKVVERDGMQVSAYVMRIAGGGNNGDRFVYVPAAMRLERWPRTVRGVPASMDAVEVIAENVWNQDDARGLVLRAIGATDTACACGGSSAGGGCGCGGTGSKGGSGGCSCGGGATGKSTAKAGNCTCGGSGTGSTGSGATGSGSTAARKPAAIAAETYEAYPAHLPGGAICGTSVTALPCTGGTGNQPRRFRSPRGLAVSKTNLLYVADTGNNRVQCINLRGLVLAGIWGRRADAAYVAALPPEQCSAPAVAVGDPIAGSRPGEFDGPWDVALDAAGNLFVTDRNNARVQRRCCTSGTFKAFAGTTLAAHVFQVLYGPHFNERYVYIPLANRLELWSGAPGSIPADAGAIQTVNATPTSLEQARVAVLDAINALGSTDILVEWETGYPEHLEADEPFVHPEHLVVDTAGLAYVTDAGRSYVKVIDGQGRVTEHITYASELTGTFPPTAITIDSAGKLIVAGGGGLHRFERAGGTFRYGGRAHACSCSRTVACDAKDRLLTCGDGEPGVAWVAPASGFEKQGIYVSAALDSGVDRCQWHRIVVEFAEAIPQGASVRVWTYASNTLLPDADIAALTPDQWRTGQLNGTDFLVLSGQGRYLWLMIEMHADGASTPAIAHLTAFFPRITYMQYLPAVYQADPVAKDFTERFLSIFETVFSSIERRVDKLEQYLDPEGVPAPFIGWLASWIDMEFWPSWSVQTRRTLLRHATELYKIRGTPRGLERFVKMALGVDIRIQEEFRRRRWLFAASGSGCGAAAPGDAASGPVLGSRTDVWGDAIVNRLQLDQYSRIGEFALVSTGDPMRDPFHVYAHRFTVFVNASDCRGDVERTIRYLIDQEKPAHTAYTLVKVEPRFRVGVQATVGLDTTIGAYPKTVLNECATLGSDTLLGTAPEDAGPAAAQVGAHTRVGVDAVVG